MDKHILFKERGPYGPSFKGRYTCIAHSVTSGNVYCFISFCSGLHQTPFHILEMEYDIDISVDKWYACFNKVINKHTPMKTKREKTLFNEEIKRKPSIITEPNKEITRRVPSYFLCIIHNC